MSSDDEIIDAAFVRTVLAASNDCIKVLNLDGDLAFMSEGGQRVMEVSDFNQLRGCPWPSLWEGQSNAEAKKAVAEARAGRNYRFQGPADTLAGNPRWWDVQVTPIPGPDGQPARLLSVSRDITGLKRSEDQHRLLALELNHRIKNVLAMVQAIASQTFRATSDPTEAKAAFLDRLGALGAAQDLLTETTLTGARMADIVADAFRPHGREGQVTASGPEVDLSPRCALAMSLALHELTTNAIKYGALSADGGRVMVSWTVTPGKDETAFVLTWAESGGPPVARPTRTGFGSGMIQRALSGYVGGATTLAYNAAGVVFTLTTTLEALTAEVK
ncbi:PAS domain-containing sensor histidine kinase [Brevundimonas sp.]|uniref:PAS domain-containing sensor histidine kinase n=1 Tax=Brevundimonas sp. TaxID=1871086 RepID=UPI00273158D5|nr:PAS domain-containing sensor histidine kinase [Brevundimonas sp.]MDP1914527.1 HWE histidine kinase domain-containing protein [Brevundimonas sp.]